MSALAADGLFLNPFTQILGFFRSLFSRAKKADQINEGFTGCGKTQIGGRRGFQPPHKASEINEGFSPCKSRSWNAFRCTSDSPLEP